MRNLFKKIFTISGLLLLTLFIFTGSIFAITQTDCLNRAEKSEFDLLSPEDVDTCVDLLKDSLSSKTSERLSLESEIKHFNNLITITTASILANIRQIENLEKEIASLSGKITTLDFSLDQLSEILIKRIAETYKKGRVNVIGLFLSSNSFSDFVSRYKYLKVIQIHDRNLMLQMETARSNFEDQKSLKEEKQKELELAKSRLENQKTLLAQQKAAKDNLLAITKNDEAKYQQFLSEAVAQQKAFKGFVSSQGGATILSNQTVCDDWGCYYNQRDSQWGNQSLGVSGLSVAEYGCLVSSVSMLASHYGVNIKPSDIASNPNAFFSNTAYLLHSFSVNGIGVSIQSVSKSLLDSKLAEGKPVIAGLYGGPDHFIVIKSKAGSDYIMNDPFLENGSNRMLSEKYSVSDVNSLRLVSF